MGVVCMVCGRLSADAEFCDHCNADLHLPASRLAPSRCPLVPGGVELTDAERQSLTHAEAHIGLSHKGQRWRVRWIAPGESANRMARLEHRLALDLKCLAPSRLVRDGEGMWLFTEAGTPSAPWEEPVDPDPWQNLRQLTGHVASLADALEELHRQQLVWLTFDPRALEEVPAAPGPAQPWRSLRITNLDLEVYQPPHVPESLRMNAKFTPPEISAFRWKDVGPRTDVYHLALFAYHWLAGLLPEGFAGAGLEHFDHLVPSLRIYAPWLPEGIIPVVERGLAHSPRQRHPSVRTLALELQHAVEQAEARRQSDEPITWEIGGETIAGRAKEALHRANEDHLLFRQFGAPPAALVAVADGISTCSVGSGELASLVTMIVLESSFVSGCSHGEFPQRIGAACRNAAQGILDWAVENGYSRQLVKGQDLMGTTLAAGWIQDRRASLANLGDSRVYLVTDDWIDQLTVDGDLASELLRRGSPPEEIKELGVVTRALRECVGGCIVTDDGKLAPLDECGHPSLSQWPLAPGDVLVFCTDGLVEEGYFLEPRTVAELVRRNRHQSADTIAHLLVEAANAQQRPPSALEPDGFGDNIACVVVKITEG
jgi:serine/threonine protein phosphatase PrpC